MGLTVEQKFSSMMVTLLEYLELNPEDPNFLDTPARWEKMMRELFLPISKQKEELDKIFSKSFPSQYEGIVAEGPIKCWSMCPHHFVTVQYVVWTAYMPEKEGSAIGISKLARCADILARTLILQEDYTKNIADTLYKRLGAAGVGVLVEGRHMCISSRGAKQDDAWTLTSEVRGVFREKESIKKEWMDMIQQTRSRM